MVDLVALYIAYPNRYLQELVQEALYIAQRTPLDVVNDYSI